MKSEHDAVGLEADIEGKYLIRFFGMRLEAVITDECGAQEIRNW